MALFERLITAALMAAALVWTLLYVAALAGLGKFDREPPSADVTATAVPLPAGADPRAERRATASPVTLPRVEISARRQTAVASRPLPLVE